MPLKGKKNKTTGPTDHSFIKAAKKGCTTPIIVMTPFLLHCLEPGYDIYGAKQ